MPLIAPSEFVEPLLLTRSIIALVAPLRIDRRLGTSRHPQAGGDLWHLRLAPPGNVMQGTSLAGRSILIVEDEPIIALGIVTAFKNAGAVVLTARSLAEASRLVEHHGLSAAVVDFGLGDHDAGALCVRLEQQCNPFMLHSGYSHHGPACRSGIVVPKPASPATLIETVAGLLHAS